MAEVRAPNESEVQNLIGFLDKHLRPDNDWSIAAEYPFVFHPLNRDNLRIIADDNQVLAHAATKYLIIKTTLGLFKVAAIGSVVTAPEQRGKGFSQLILKNVLQSAEAECADFAILWTDLYDLYRKSGFELAGSEISVIIDDPIPFQQDKYRILKSEKVAPEAILKLYSMHTCGSVRTAEEIRRNLQIPNSRVYTMWDNANQLLAYAIEGKGADLKGYVHEWGGSVPNIIHLLAHIRKDLGSPLTVMTSTVSENLRRELRKYNVTEHKGYLGMILPINFDSLFMKIKRHARANGLTDFIMEKKDGKFFVGTPGDVTEITDIQTLTRLIFGPIDPAQLNPQYQNIFPIPMWIWGWDSV